MKKIKKLLLIVFITLASLSSFNCGDTKSETPTVQTVETTVYVCTGPYAKRYHKNSWCRGLNKCGGNIISMDKKDAESSGKTPCQICY